MVNRGDFDGQVCGSNPGKVLGFFCCGFRPNSRWRGVRYFPLLPIVTVRYSRPLLSVTIDRFCRPLLSTVTAVRYYRFRRRLLSSVSAVRYSRPFLLSVTLERYDRPLLDRFSRPLLDRFWNCFSLPDRYSTVTLWKKSGFLLGFRPLM